MAEVGRYVNVDMAVPRVMDASGSVWPQKATFFRRGVVDQSPTRFSRTPPRRGAAATETLTYFGNVSVNTEPCDTSLVADSSPCMAVANSRLIVRPSPDPPYASSTGE